VKSSPLKRWTWQTLFGWTIILLLLAAGFGVRMVNLKSPPLDFHPVRQLRSALIARDVFYQLNTAADPALRAAAQALTPTDIHEPPVVEQMVGFTYYLLGSEQVWIARIFSALFWLVGGAALFALARRRTSLPAALVGLAFYLLLPFGIVASRSFQPDPWMVMWILLTVWAADHWLETPTWKWTIITGVLGGVAILVKVMAGLFIAGVLALVLLAGVGLRGLLRSLKPWVMAAVVLAPAAIYYLVFHSGRSAEYFSFWTLGFVGMLVTSKFYIQWLAMINSLAGWTMLLLAGLGVVLAQPKFRWSLTGLWIGYILFGLAWPFQYTTHDYYHLMLVPVIGLSITPVADVFFRKLMEQSWLWRAAGVALIVAAAGFQGYIGRSELVASGGDLEPRSWQKVGESIPAGASFVALTADYGLRLNYYGWRQASYYWPAQADLDMETIRSATPPGGNTREMFNAVTAGHPYFLVTALTELDAQPELKAILTQKYPVFFQGNGWTIYDLAHPRANP
jgi:hypothetical protein